MVKEIPLTQGKVALVDDEDYERVIQFKWCAVKDKNTWYAERGQWIPSEKRVKGIRMHRFILGLKNKKEQTDHINGDGLDNRRCNLRIVTIAQNMMNSRKRSKSTLSKYKGVTLRKDLNKWAAEITINRKPIRLGHFSNEKDAARAYNKAAKKYHGEYARLNIIEVDKNE